MLEFKGSWDRYLPLMEFAYNNSYQSSIEMAPYEALYGRKCRTPLCWDKVGERKLLGPEIVQVTIDNVKVIRDRLKIAQDRQKSYADNRMRDMEFQVGDQIFLRISPWKGVLRFEKKGKLSPQYIREVAYPLRLPPELARIQDIFHVSMLRKYITDPSHVLRDKLVELKEYLSYDERYVQIVDRKDQVLWNKVIPLVKLWMNHSREEATWVREDRMKTQYPHLF